jgi:tRNA threonylcarbamoyladenosine biosynthesis protein TsaB
MRTLAIDTSHLSGTVAASDGERIVVRPLGVAGEHARLLAAMLTEVAQELGWPLSTADLVAVVRGPGSFTGLRVGVATAKAIAWAGGMRLVGVSGFEAVAQETARLTGWHDEPLEIAFDAGRGEVYAARVTADAAAPSGWRIGAAAIHEAAAWIAALPPTSCVSGPGMQLHAADVTARGHRVAPAEGWLPNAAVVAGLATARAAVGAVDEPHTLVPDYLRPSYADERVAAHETPPAVGRRA